jgi:histidyl-tRNA synthetase
MAIKKTPYKGCRDLFPEQKLLQDHLFSIMKHTSKLFAFRPYDGPLLEPIDLYLAKSGEELINDQIYSFKDRGDRTVAIRPEMTPTLARMIAQVVKEVSKPIRWYSIPNLMRYERPQKGRLREHWQWNIDIFGQEPGFGEIEILQLIIHFFNSLGANQEHFEIKLNDRQLINFFFGQFLKLSDEDSYKLIKLVDRSLKVSPEQFKKDLSDIIADASKQEVFETYLQLNDFPSLIKFLDQINCPHDKVDIIKLYQIAKQSSLIDYLSFSPNVVRGLDYYTGVVFEIFDKHPDNRRALCGGGAYSQLLKIFNEPEIHAVGFGMGDVTLVDFLTTHNILPKISKAPAEVSVAFENSQFLNQSLDLTQKLRSINLSVEFNFLPAKNNKAFKVAQKKAFNYFVFVYESDGQTKINLKNMNNKKSKEVEFTTDEDTLRALFEEINGD